MSSIHVVKPSCSFCKKSSNEVAMIVAAEPPSAICSECWELTADVIGEKLGCEPSMVYIELKRARLNALELTLRRQVSIDRILETRDSETTESPDATLGSESSE